MGAFRLFLALSVVAGHVPFFYPSEVWVNAGVAVNCFFVVSGFYMALIITTSYSALPNWRRRFLANRVLRLYPCYYVALLFVTVFTGSSGAIFAYPAKETWQAFLPLLNFTILGQDVFMWASQTHLLDVPNTVIIQPAWSIGTELVFYCCAAALFHRSQGILAFFAVALGAHLLSQRYGLPTATLPTNLGVFFAMGGMAYLLCPTISAWPLRHRQIGAAASAVGVALLCWSGSSANAWALYVATALMTPLMFSVTGESIVDRFMGDLSYPIYLIHIGLFSTAQWDRFAVPPAEFTVVLLALSAAIVFGIERPIETLRRRIARRGKESRPAPQLHLVKAA